MSQEAAYIQIGLIPHEMVKRKAVISLDEWLSRGIANPETSHLTATTSTEGKAEPDCVPAEVAVPTVTGDQVAKPLATGEQVANPTVTVGHVFQSTATGEHVVNSAVIGGRGTHCSGRPAQSIGGRLRVVLVDPGTSRI